MIKMGLTEINNINLITLCASQQPNIIFFFVIAIISVVGMFGIVK